MNQSATDLPGSRYSQPLSGSPSSKRALELSARFWFSVAVIGQWIFVFYIVLFYGVTAVTGNFDKWTDVLPTGLINGDSLGNIALVAHILIAALITFAGPLQLISAVRTKAPRFHHWNGRVYIVTAFVMSLSGIYIVWTRGTVGNWVQHTAISINGMLIMLFAIVALRYAIARKITQHRRWALRLFMVVSGVWFFRVGLMFWLAANQAPVGIDFETFTGPFLYFLAFAQYLVPLLLLEMYFRAQASASLAFQWGATMAIIVATIATGIGIFAASAGMWFPKVT